MKKYKIENKALKKTNGSSTRHWPNQLKIIEIKINKKTKNLLSTFNTE
jgi:hypothetical protein